MKIRLRDRIQKLLAYASSRDRGREDRNGRLSREEARDSGVEAMEVADSVSKHSTFEADEVPARGSRRKSAAAPALAQAQHAGDAPLCSPSFSRTLPEAPQVSGEAAGGQPPALQLQALIRGLSTGNQDDQASAVEELFNMVAENQAAREMAGQMGAVSGLVGLLKEGSDSSKMYAAYTLSSLTSSGSSRAEMMRLSTVQLLVDILRRSPLVMAKKGAVRALGRLARDADAARQVVAAGALEPIIQAMESSDNALVRRCLIALYFISADNQDLQVAVCKAGGLLPCVALCTSPSAEIQSEAADVVKALSRCPLAHRQMIDSGLLPIASLRETARQGLSSRSRASASKALQRLANHGPPALALLINGEEDKGRPASKNNNDGVPRDDDEEAEMIQQLSSIFTQGDSWLQAQAARAVMEVAMDDPTASHELAQNGIVGHLVDLLVRGTSDSRLGCAHALARMAAHEQILQLIVENRAIPALVECMHDSTAQEGAAAALEVLAAHRQTAFILVGEGAILPLTSCLGTGNEITKTASARALFLLANADEGVIPQVFEAFAVCGQMIRADGVRHLINCAWQGHHKLQGIALAILREIMSVPKHRQLCCSQGIVGLLMWVTRSDVPEELQEAAAEMLAELSASSSVMDLVRVETALQSKISILLAEVREHVQVSPKIEQAFCTVPRGMFLMESLDKAYHDTRVPLQQIGTELNAAHADIQLLEALQLEPGHTVLDAGSGSGFTAALMAVVVGKSGHVTGVEVNEVAAFHSEFCLEAVMHQRQLSDLKIDFLLRDAFELRSSMCFDRILVGGDCPPEELQALYLHLNDGGIMVAPSQGQLIRIGKDQGFNHPQILGEFDFPPLYRRGAVKVGQHKDRSMSPDGEEVAQDALSDRKNSNLDASTMSHQSETVPTSPRANPRADANPSTASWDMASPDKTLLMSLDDIEICTTTDGKRCRLGEGGFGVVYKAIIHGVDEVAVKLVKADNPTEKDIQQFSREVQVLRSLHHRNIVQFYGACLEPGSMFFVTELMKGGDLYSALRHHPETMRWDRLGKKVMLDIALGMNYLHSRKPPMMHRDLKSPNVLLSEEGVAKIADVGMVRTQMEKLVTAQPVMTPLWAAPEVIRHERASIKADIWSYGVLIWEVISQQDIAEFQPLAVARQMRGAKPIQPPMGSPPVAVRLFRECTQMEADLRPTAARIVEILRQDAV